jgi:ribonuclease HI
LKDPSKRLYPDRDDGQILINTRNDDPAPLAKRPCTYKANHGDGTLVDRTPIWQPPLSPDDDDDNQHAKFDAVFFCKEDGDGVEFARQVWEMPETEGDLVRLRFSVDASTKNISDPDYNGSAGAFSVVYKKPGVNSQYVEQAWFVDRMFNNNWGEMLAIAEAINMAVLRLGLMPSFQASEVYIFTDSRCSINFLRGKVDAQKGLYGTSMSSLRSFITQRSKELRELRCSLTISQIKGHKHDIKSHQLADNAARKMYSNGKKALEKGCIPAAYHCNIDDRTMPAHNTIWPVLHHEAVRRLEYAKELNATQAHISRLKELLALPSWRRAARGNKEEIRAL